MTQVIVFLALIVSSASLAAASRMSSTCDAIVKQGGGTGRFAANVAHGMHSITLDTLKMFEATATEKNMVPTVNRDHSSPQMVLRYSPDVKQGDAFPTAAMNDLDMVLSQMDDPGYMSNGKSAVEALFHQIHMREIWDLTLEQYKSVKKSPPTDSFCKCALDVENNGIVEMHEVHAQIQKRREELVNWARTAEKVLPAETISSMLRYGHIFAYIVHVHSLHKDDVAPIGLFETKLRKPTQENLKILGLEDGNVDKVGPAAWKLMSQDLQGVSATDNALFLYCALNKTP